MDASLLTATQWTRASAYLVLWKYALPQLTNWTDGDRFQSMITFYRDMYHQELQAVYDDGVEYDFDDDGTIESGEEMNIRVSGRLNR